MDIETAQFEREEMERELSPQGIIERHLSDHGEDPWADIQRESWKEPQGDEGEDELPDPPSQVPDDDPADRPF